MTTQSLAPQLIHADAANGQLASKLLVLVHGYFKTAASLRPLIDVLRQDAALKEYDFLLLPYAVGRLRNASPDNLALTLNSSLTGMLRGGSNYTTITLLGHSLGGLLVRHMYLIAKGVTRLNDAIIDQPWADQVETLILVSSPNRGLSLQRWGWAGRLFIRLAARLGMAKLIYSALPGSEFITNLRLDWMEEMHQLGDAAPKVVQVLGTRDSEVLREDSIDVVQFKNACHLFVPDEDHNSIIDVHPGDQKYLFLRDAIITGEWLKKAVMESPVGMDNGAATAEPASAVVFLVHGIRDYGAWMEPLDKLIGLRDTQIKRIRPSYDYFSLLQFVLTPLRRSKLAWFRDQYTQARARYPGVPIHYIGHSNGTYILANTLKRFRSIKVERVYFAGSVLPRDFDWQDLFDHGQLKLLRNDCAAADWPVGVICAGLSPIMPRELGIAGFQGFTFGDATLAHQLRYIAGGHGAAMDGADKQASIADFITGGKGAEPPLTTPTQWFELANKLAPFLFIFAVVLFVAILWGLMSMALWGGLLGIAGALFGLVVLMFLFLRI
jgi:pimeloyl-ACP methyl ester carboxylesterase